MRGTSNETPRPSNRRRKLAALLVMALLAPTLLISPVGAVTVPLTAANDVPITQVILNDGTADITQTASVPAGAANNTPGNGPIELVEITVNDGGPVELDIYNFVTSVDNYNFPPGLTGVRTWQNGVATELNNDPVTGAPSPAFEAAVLSTLGSTDVRDYLAYDGIQINGANADGSEFNPDFDAFIAGPLFNDDYIVVQERNGNTDFDLTPLDINGNPIPGANTLLFDAPYGWNTGVSLLAPQPTNQPQWLLVADVEDFGIDADVTPIYGFRVNNDGEADVKFFGASASASIHGTVTVDTTGAPIPGVTVDLTGTGNNGTVVAETTTTDAAGDYWFEDLPPGTYTVTETQPAGFGDGSETAGTNGGDDSVDDVISDIVLSGGDMSEDNDFEETLLPASIHGTVVDNTGAPIPFVTIDLSGDATATATTDAAGDYWFEDLAPGEYTVTETQPAGFLDGGETAGTSGGDDSVDDVISGIVLAAGDMSEDNDFDEIIPASIHGTVFEDLNNDGVVDAGEPPIPGVTVTLGGDATAVATTDAAGEYWFEDLAPGEYTVTETQPAGFLDGIDTAGTSGGDDTVDDVISGIVLAAGDVSEENDFGELPPASIHGTVIDDTGAPIPGVTIDLSGDATATATTDAAGDYWFEDLAPGEYTVTETQPAGFDDGGETAGTSGGDDSVDDVISGIVLAAGDMSEDNDFDEIVPPVPPASIHGTVFEDLNNDGVLDAGEPPIPGVTVTLGGDATAVATTDAAGEYWFENMESSSDRDISAPGHQLR